MVSDFFCEYHIKKHKIFYSPKRNDNNYNHDHDRVYGWLSIHQQLAGFLPAHFDCAQCRLGGLCQVPAGSFGWWLQLPVQVCIYLYRPLGQYPLKIYRASTNGRAGDIGGEPLLSVRIDAPRL